MPYKWLVAVAFLLGLFMDILDTTIVNVALPTLSREFGILATILIERRDALVGPETGPAAVEGLVQAFHQAFLGSVILAVLAFIAASSIRDIDAAPTMRPRPAKT